MDGSPENMIRKKEFHQRNEMEHHAEAGGVQRDSTEKVAGSPQRKKSVCQAHEVASQRKAQPKYWHGVGKYRSPQRLMQGEIGPRVV